MKSFLNLSLLSLVAGVFGGYSRRKGPTCKAVPGGIGWPTEEDWKTLSVAPKGRLLKPDPPAAPCHRNSQMYDSGECESITRGFVDSAWHAENPISNMWQ